MKTYVKKTYRVIVREVVFREVVRDALNAQAAQEWVESQDWRNFDVMKNRGEAEVVSVEKAFHSEDECDEECSGCARCYQRTGEWFCDRLCEHAPPLSHL